MLQQREWVGSLSKLQSIVRQCSFSSSWEATWTLKWELKRERKFLLVHTSNIMATYWLIDGIFSFSFFFLLFLFFYMIKKILSHFSLSLPLSCLLLFFYSSFFPRPVATSALVLMNCSTYATHTQHNTRNSSGEVRIWRLTKETIASIKTNQTSKWTFHGIPSMLRVHN